jgi:hypothetical protein
MATGVGLGYFYAQGSRASEALTVQDHVEIQQLYWQYNQGLDFRDEELFMSVFATDAVWKTGPQQEYVGRKAIGAFIPQTSGGKTGATGRRHWNNSWWIRPSGEGAQGRVYWLVLDVSARQPAATLSGYYEDVYVKTSEGWRIKSRIVRFDAK